MSLLYHPDKETGDERKFLMISKAYAALTDEESRKNWELYGNPDGPGATSFGIALPSWIVEKENSFIVLGLYALVFMIALPTVVGIWWYNSVKYGGDQVLLDTTQLFYCFIHKSPHMVLKRVIMIIAASLEFEKSHNSEVVERPTDNVEVPALIRDLQSECNLNEKNKERPLCYHYSIKARALLYAHLYRIHLPPSTLDLDRQFIVRKCPTLIHEFVQCVAQLTMLAIAGRIPRCPSIDTLESAMKLSPLIVQAVSESRSIFFQLPHFSDDVVKMLSHKKFNVRSFDQFAKMDQNDRRTMLRSLSDDQFEDILLVLSDMPIIDLSVKTEVLDDEDSGVITAGAIVTVTATLKRLTYGSVYGINSEPTNGPLVGSTHGDHDDENEPFLANGGSSAQSKPAVQMNSKPVWQKREKGKKKKGKGSGKVQKKQVQPVQSSKVSKVDGSDVSDRESGQESENESESGVSEESQTKGGVSEESQTKRGVSQTKGGVSQTKGGGSEESQTKGEESEGEEGTGGSEGEMEEKDWSRMNRKCKKGKDPMSTLSHSVHSPYFPDDKQEYWWIYVSDKKKHSLTTVPVLMTNLLSQESVDLKFTAPHKPGIYTYTVIARSDSYVDCVKEEVIKVIVN